MIHRSITYIFMFRDVFPHNQNEEGKTLNAPEETYEFKQLRPSIIFVSPVIINVQIGKMCHDTRFYCPYAFSCCHGLKYVWGEMPSFCKVVRVVMVQNVFGSNCPVLITSFSGHVLTIHIIEKAQIRFIFNHRS